MDFRKFLNLFESIDQLDEDIGNLRNLNAGDLLNVFKQNPSRDQSNTKSFVRGWSDGIGQNSELVNLGKIKSWKDLRKASSANPSLMGAIFYVDGTAFAAINYTTTSINLRAPSSTVMFAFDPSKLPELPQEQPPEGLSGWALDRWQDDQRRRIPSGTASERKHWDDTLKKYTGTPVELRGLEKYLDRVIDLFPEHEFTAVGITTDKAATQTAKDRAERAQRDDPLIARAAQNYYGSRNPELQRALNKYKASKEFDNFSMPEQVLEFVADMDNYSKTFVYKGTRYKYEVKEKVSVPVEALMLNKTFTFRASLNAADSGVYSSVYVTFQVENGTVTPIKVD
jgi:hypothetical protein